jgi:nucleotidyltransferase substrate binding protein (TIGR01987 family)
MQPHPQHPTQPLKNALAALQKALVTTPMTDIVCDGVLHRFKFTFELCWKTIRIALRALGRDVQSSSPKPLFRDALAENFIESIELWFAFLHARNLLSHTYDEEQAQTIFAEVHNFPPLCAALLGKLEAVDYD